MNEKINYQLMLDNEIKKTKRESPDKRPSLLLHACCAPCSSYVLSYLAEHFDITVFFYNPNISPKEENDFRAAELERLCQELPLEYVPKVIVAEYEPEKFYSAVKGYEDLPEGGARCAICYRLRLEKTAAVAKEMGFDYFTTTLSISPYKRADWLNSIGAQLEKAYGVRYLYSDFKKKNGYKISCELSKEYNLYRQDYCGCEFSKAANEKNKL